VPGGWRQQFLAKIHRRFFFRDPAAATLNASNFPDTGERGLSRRRLLVGVSGPFLSGVHAKSSKTHLLYSYYAKSSLTNSIGFSMSDIANPSSHSITVRALLLGDRVETAGLERNDVLSTTPLAFRAAHDGYVVLFRYGVVVLFGMSPVEEDEIVRRLAGRIVGLFSRREDDSTQIEITPEKDEQITPDGKILLRKLTPEHVLIVADAMATNLILAHDERNVSAVFDVIEPLARELAEQGRTPGGRRTILKHIGNALLVQHRVSGLVAVAEKPDVLWERPDLERFYARLEDEYELKERADLLSRKLKVISDTGKALADIIDTERSLRLERIIIVLILLETIFTAYQIFIH